MGRRSTRRRARGMRKQRRRSSFSVWLLRLGLATIAGFALLEVVARYCFDLGDPPRMMSDPLIEYLYRPNQTCRRFGNLIHYNAYSMRADDFPPHKRSPHELRVMVVGDSVINGGAPTNQSQLATAILQRELSARLHRPVIVGNCSAPSWGPPNELAYMLRYGLFDADVVVIVLSSHDYADAPTFKSRVGVSPAAPDQQPYTAATELLLRYLIP